MSGFLQVFNIASQLKCLTDENDLLKGWRDRKFQHLEKYILTSGLLHSVVKPREGKPQLPNKHSYIWSSV